MALARALAQAAAGAAARRAAGGARQEAARETQIELMELQRRLGITFVIVTHDQEEAMTMADRIGVMDAAGSSRSATPRADLRGAATRAGSPSFVGDVNLLDGQVERREAHRLTMSTRDAGTSSSPSRGQPVEQDHGQRRDPAGKDQAVAPRAGVGCRRRDAINRLEGVVTEVSYLGGLTTYKVKLMPARCCARRWPTPRGSTSTPIVSASASVALVRARRLRGAGAMSDAHRIFARPARLAASRLICGWLLFFLVPFGFVLKISLSQTAIAQPPYMPVFDSPRAGRRSRQAFVGAVAGQFQAAGLRQPLCAVLSAQPRGRAGLDRDAALIGYPIAYGMARAAAALAGGRDDAGDRAVLDLVPDPHLCLDQHPAARRPAQQSAAGAAHRRRAGGVAVDRQRDVSRHRLFLSAVHDPAALRDAGEDGSGAAGSRRRSRRLARGRRSGW